MPKIQDADDLLNILSLLAFFRKTTLETIENFPDQENSSPVFGQLLVWLEHASISAANAAHPASTTIIQEACMACMRNIQTGSPYDWQGAWKNTTEKETDHMPFARFMPVGWLEKAGGKEDNFVEEVSPDPPMDDREDGSEEDPEDGSEEEPEDGSDEKGGWNVVAGNFKPPVAPRAKPKPKPLELIFRGDDFMSPGTEEIYPIVGKIPEIRLQMFVEVKNYTLDGYGNIVVGEDTEVTEKVYEGVTNKFHTFGKDHVNVIVDGKPYEASDALMKAAGLWNKKGVKGEKVKFKAFQKLDRFNDYRISRRKDQHGNLTDKFFYPSVSEIVV